MAKHEEIKKIKLENVKIEFCHLTIKPIRLGNLVGNANTKNSNSYTCLETSYSQSMSTRRKGQALVVLLVALLPRGLPEGRASPLSL